MSCKKSEYGVVYDISVFNNCIIYTSSNLINKNIIKKYVLHEELFQLKGLVNHIRNNVYMVSHRAFRFDSLILDYIDKNYDKWESDKISEKDILEDIILFSSSILNTESYVFKGKYIEMNDMISTLKLRPKNSKSIIETFSYDINNLSSSHPNKSIDSKNMEQACEYNFNKVLKLNLMYHGLFNANDIREYCNKKGVIHVDYTKDSEQINMF